VLFCFCCTYCIIDSLSHQRLLFTCPMHLQLMIQCLFVFPLPFPCGQLIRQNPPNIRTNVRNTQRGIQIQFHLQRILTSSAVDAKHLHSRPSQLLLIHDSRRPNLTWIREWIIIRIQKPMCRILSLGFIYQRRINIVPLVYMGWSQMCTTSRS